MKQPFQGLAIAVAAAFGLAACTSLHVRSDTNAKLVGSVHCHTVAWAGSFHGDSPLRGTIANPVNESRLRDAIASHFTSMGVTIVNSDADCLVGYGIGTHTVVEGAYPYGWYGWGWGPGWGWPGPAWAWDGPFVYNEGIIGVDLYDAKSRQPLWHASVDQNLSGLTGAEAEKKIDAAVAAIFTKYPG